MISFYFLLSETEIKCSFFNTLKKIQDENRWRFHLFLVKGNKEMKE